MCAAAENEHARSQRVAELAETLASLDGHIASQVKLMQMFEDCNTADSRSLLTSMLSERRRLSTLLNSIDQQPAAIVQRAPTKALKLLGVTVAADRRT